MLGGLIIVFREVFEAGLVVGIVLAATQGIARRGMWMAGGIAAGVLGAALLAVFAGALESAFAGDGQEMFNACILSAAVLMLAWHQTWMAAHARQHSREMREMGKEVAAGRRSLFAMALVVAIAVLREGSEVVLFLYGMVAAGHEGWPSVLLGGAIGVALGALVSFALYRGLIAIPVSRLFAVMSWLIALLAAGMAGQAAAILAKADLIPAWGFAIWNTSHILPESGLAGRTLHALVGYSERPVGIQLAAWAAVMILMVGGSRLVRTLPARRPAGITSSPEVA